MMPGITNLPDRSVVSAPVGALSCEAGPIQEMRPLSMIIAALGTGAPPLPSIRVKFLSTLVSALRASATRKSALAALLAIDRFLKNAFGSRRIEHAAGTETRHVGDGLIRRAAAFLDPVDHLARKLVADHAVAAHGGQHHDLRVGQLFGFAFEPERIADAVARNAGMMATLLGAVDGGGDIDAEAEVFLFDAFDEIFGGDT